MTPTPPPSLTELFSSGWELLKFLFGFLLEVIALGVGLLSIVNLFWILSL